MGICMSTVRNPGKKLRTAPKADSKPQLDTSKVPHRHRHRPHPHLVCGDGRLFRKEAVRCSVCSYYPLPGAASRVEGGATRQWVCDEFLDGKNSHSRRRRHCRCFRRHEGGHPSRLPGGKGRTNPCHL